MEAQNRRSIDWTCDGLTKLRVVILILTAWSSKRKNGVDRKEAKEVVKMVKIDNN